MTSQLVCCEFCGRDTRSRTRICKECLGASGHNREHAASSMTPLTKWDDEFEDFSENSLGPKQAEDRLDAIWIDEGDEWRRMSGQR